MPFFLLRLLDGCRSLLERCFGEAAPRPSFHRTALPDSWRPAPPGASLFLPQGLGTNARASLPKSHLLDPELLNGTSEAESVWHALQELIPAPATLSGTQPPTDLLSSLSESLSSHTTPPEIKCIYTELLVASAADAFQRDDLEVFDDGALCLSAPLHATHPSQVVLAPHSIELVDLPTENSTTVQTAGGSWWDIPWQGGRKLRKRRVLAKKVRIRFCFALSGY